MFNHMISSRRRFLGATGGAFAALAASGCVRPSLGAGSARSSYGPLVPDPAGYMDLPEGFSWRAISRLGDPMTDGGTVPDMADGMACFDIGKGRIALVRNHELTPEMDGGGAVGPAFDTVARSLVPLPGGTTTLVLDAATLAVERQYRSLQGTIRNCGGGVTPWGSWLTCEEYVASPDGKINKPHGWVFEVPVAATGPVEPVPLVAMGRFNHEAACVDPATGMVYMTEDRDDSVLYRFVPTVAGRLAAGGKLQALALDAIQDTRNWTRPDMAVGERHTVRWIDLDDPEAPADDLRHRAAAQGAALFARGEGMHMGDGELYFCCTSGGGARVGQVFRLKLGRGRNADRLDLFFESASAQQFEYGDNIAVTPGGHLLVCEDQPGDAVANRLLWITPEGAVHTLALLHRQTEFAGACFSPDGRTLFVNAQSPTCTLAITGPWLT